LTRSGLICLFAGAALLSLGGVQERSAEAKGAIKYKPARSAGASTSPATFRGKVKTKKPARAFFDPRKGGEWWRCPKSRPRRTAYRVTDRRACATKHIFGEKLARAKYLGKVRRSKPVGAFLDIRNGGEYWSCPAGYNRTVLAVTSARACERAGCPKGSFKNGLFGGCYRCPKGYKRSLAIGADLTKLKTACMKPRINKRAFAKARKRHFKKLKKKLKKFKKRYKRDIKKLVKLLKRQRGMVAELRKAKSKRAQGKIIKRWAKSFTRWGKKRARKKFVENVENANSDWAAAGDSGVHQAPAGSAVFSMPGTIAGRRPGGAMSRLRVAAKKDCTAEGKKMCSMTIGFMPFSFSIVIGMTGVADWAFDLVGSNRPAEQGTFYFTLGAAAAGSVGAVIGVWKLGNVALGQLQRERGNQGFASYHGVVVNVFGGAVGFWWDLKGNFLGFSVRLAAGVGAGVEYARGHFNG